MNKITSKIQQYSSLIAHQQAEADRKKLEIEHDKQEILAIKAQN